MKRLRILLSSALALGCALPAMAQLTRALTESPKYKVTAKPDGFEVREYPEMAVVSTKMSPAANRAQQDDRFMRLFRYIDKGNERKQKISMTSPVFMESGGETGAMSFVIPAEVKKEGAPEPSAENVSLKTIAAGKFAVLRFKGGRSGTAEAKAVAKLKERMEKAGLKAAAGDPMFAYYDPPWTPKALRRNEVLIRLK
jgi:DNA gyrase inhibitor GyrI